MEKTVTAVLVAAGSSRRMGFDKLSAPLGGGTVLSASVAAFDRHPLVSELVIVTGADETAARAAAACCQKPVTLAKGGATRALSALAGVRTAKGELVAIHDAARPFVSEAVITRVLEAWNGGVGGFRTGFGPDRACPERLLYLWSAAEPPKNCLRETCGVLISIPSFLRRFGVAAYRGAITPRFTQVCQQVRGCASPAGSASLAAVRIERIGKTVAQEVEAQRCDEHRDAGEDDEVR